MAKRPPTLSGWNPSNAYVHEVTSANFEAVCEHATVSLAALLPSSLRPTQPITPSFATSSVAHSPSPDSAADSAALSLRRDDRQRRGGQDVDGSSRDDGSVSGGKRDGHDGRRASGQTLRGTLTAVAGPHTSTDDAQRADGLRDRDCRDGVSVDGQRASGLRDVDRAAGPRTPEVLVGPAGRGPRAGTRAASSNAGRE